MNRRNLLSLIAALPIIGAFVKPSDGVALRSISHPVSVDSLDTSYEPGNIVTTEITLTPYALAGEHVTCENNHLICSFLEEVYVGQMQDLQSQLGLWQQDEPQVGMEIPVCAICGALFYKTGGVFHFRDGGWRKGLFKPLRLKRGI